MRAPFLEKETPLNWFVNLKTAYKLALGFGLCLSFAVLISGVAI